MILNAVLYCKGREKDKSADGDHSASRRGKPDDGDLAPLRFPGEIYEHLEREQDKAPYTDKLQQLHWKHSFHPPVNVSPSRRCVFDTIAEHFSITFGEDFMFLKVCCI